VAETAHISIDDAILIKRWRRGDLDAMERLIIKYQNRIYNVILKICANVDDASELTQETFVKIIENIDGFEGRSSFYTWAFRIAVNLTLNYCQRGLKRSHSSIDAESGEANWRAKGALKEYLEDESSPDPVKTVETDELYKIVLAALMRLDEDQRAVVVLRDIEGMNYAQIAKVLDIELGTVKSRLSRARGNLREILEAVSK
jgi:RNA polymerase sigma-70 factor (ECF subfamily)